MASRTVTLDRLSIALACALVAGCDPGPESPEVALPTWTVATTPVLRIGQVDGDAPYVFSRIAGVALLEDGSVAVADGASNEIRVFDQDGAIRTVAGGMGDGPGEFRWINDLTYRPPDTLHVFDPEQGRLTALRTDGSLAGSTVTFRADDGRVEIYLGRFDDGSHALAWIRQGEERDGTRLAPDRMAVGHFDADGTMLASLPEDVGMRRLGRGPVPFSPHFMGRVTDQVVLYGDGATPELRRAGPSGTALPPLTLDLPTRSLDDAWAALLPHTDSSEVTYFAEIRDAPGLDSIPYYSEVRVDDGGRLWVKAYDPAVDSHWRLRMRTGGRWTVIDPDGSVVGHAELPDGFRLMDVRESRVAGVSRDELGVEYVEVRVVFR